MVGPMGFLGVAWEEAAYDRFSLIIMKKLRT